MKVERLAVTGYPGWLTNALLEALEDGGDGAPSSLTLLVHPSMAARAREAQARYSPSTEVVPYDLGAPQSIEEQLRGVDVVLHTAAVIHVRRTRDWYDVNAKGTIELARQAKRAGVRRFVFVSSIAAAGKSKPGRPLVEEDASRPAHHYGRSKLQAEQAILAMQEPGVFEVVILRPSMFYGPPVPDRHVDIYKRILSSWMPLVGGGRYERSLIHIDNLVQAARRAMVVDEAAGRTYFIVDRPIYSTLGVTEAMAEALGTKARYVPLPASLAELAYQIDRAISLLGIYVAPIHLLGESHWHQAASCERAMRELGYRPTKELRGGMRGAIEWCRRSGKL